MPETRGSRTVPHPHDHVVQFYDSDDFLIDAVADFLLPAIGAGDAAVVVATAEHRIELDQRLAGAGIDPAEAREEGRYFTLDAQATLDLFMVDGAPDPQRFKAAIGAVIESASAGGKRVSAFGEMVAVLWARDEVVAAIELEELWNALAHDYEFSLFCAYPMGGFRGDASGHAFDQVCATHSHVLPTEGYSRAADQDERSRTVARAQQRALAGAFETEALRQKQQELEAALEQVRELDRLRNDFIAMVVHDIRSPLSIIGGFLDLLRDNLYSLPEDQVRELIDKGLDNTKRVSRLTDDVLTIARLESGRFTYDLKPFDLAEVVYRTTAEIRATAPGIALKVSIPADLPRAYGDEGRQMQILSNLLSNAAKFSEDGEAIAVTVRRDGDKLVVSVEDQGCGIAPQDLPKVFERFSRIEQAGRRNVKGTGLGLYICKSLVEGQGGSIWVESREGQGTTFSYTLPIERRR